VRMKIWVHPVARSLGPDSIPEPGPLMSPEKAAEERDAVMRACGPGLAALARWQSASLVRARTRHIPGMGR